MGRRGMDRPTPSGHHRRGTGDREVGARRPCGYTMGARGRARVDSDVLRGSERSLPSSADGDAFGRGAGRAWTQGAADQGRPDPRSVRDTCGRSDLACHYHEGDPARRRPALDRPSQHGAARPHAGDRVEPFAHATAHAARRHHNPDARSEWSRGSTGREAAVGDGIPRDRRRPARRAGGQRTARTDPRPARVTRLSRGSPRGHRRKSTSDPRVDRASRAGGRARTARRRSRRDR